MKWLSPETVLSICNVISTPFRVSCFSQLLWCVSFQFISPLQHLPSSDLCPASKLLHIWFILNLPWFHNQHPVVASPALLACPHSLSPSFVYLTTVLFHTKPHNPPPICLWPFLKYDLLTIPNGISHERRYKELLNIRKGPQHTNTQRNAN